MARESTRPLSRPTTNMAAAVAMAPGRMIIPVCSAVTCNMFWRNSGRMKTDP